jgi:hypothetical protein
MATPRRLMPLLAQVGFARKRLADRMAGPVHHHRLAIGPPQ